MLRHGEIKFLIELYKNNGKLTFKQQETFKCSNWFYQSMTHLKNKGFIETEYLQMDKKKEINLSNKRINVYLLTYKGMELVKLLID